MIGKLFGKEVNAALVLALSGTVVALVANGPGRGAVREFGNAFCAACVEREGLGYAPGAS